MSAIRKEDSMLLQKQMISDHYDRLASAHDEGQKVVYTPEASRARARAN
jgi:hypothetical protein